MRNASNGLSMRGTTSHHLAPMCMQLTFFLIAKCLEGNSFEGTSGIDFGCGQGHPCQLALALGASFVVALDFPHVVRSLQERYEPNDRVIYASFDVDTLQFVDDAAVGDGLAGADFMLCIIGNLSTTIQVIRGFFACSTARVLAFMVPTNPTERNVVYTYIVHRKTAFWWCWISITLSGSSERRRMCIVSKHKPTHDDTGGACGYHWQTSLASKLDAAKSTLENCTTRA